MKLGEDVPWDKGSEPTHLSKFMDQAYAPDVALVVFVVNSFILRPHPRTWCCRSSSVSTFTSSMSSRKALQVRVKAIVIDPSLNATDGLVQDIDPNTLARSGCEIKTYMCYGKREYYGRPTLSRPALTKICLIGR